MNKWHSVEINKTFFQIFRVGKSVISSFSCTEFSEEKQSCAIYKYAMYKQQMELELK